MSLLLVALAALMLGILTVHVARQPSGPVRWPWFVVLSLLGGLCFGRPFFWWLNTPSHRTSAAGPGAGRGTGAII